MKLSKFACISQDFILSKCNSSKCEKLVLSSNHPDGYYERLAVEKNTVKEHHFFLLVKKEVTCFQDRVFRTISFYEKKNKVDVNAFPGRINYKNKSHSCIRFRESELEMILELIPEFENRGIEFFDNKKSKFEPYETVVQFKKYIDADEIKENIFKDNIAKNIYYVPISEDIEFDFFKKVIDYIRNNCDFKSFDASLVYSLDSKYRVQDYVMIYSPNCQVDRLLEFKEKLPDALKVVKRIG